MAKNTHLEHIEDDILNQGMEGGFNAIKFLTELGDMLDQPGSAIRVTTKWDGAPAIICGKDPSNGKFFVGTKSVFAKTAPKVIYSEADADKIYPNQGQLTQKLKHIVIIRLFLIYQILHYQIVDYRRLILISLEILLLLIYILPLKQMLVYQLLF